MASNRYEKYIGYDQDELKYKKEMVEDEVSGNVQEKRVKRTDREIEEYKAQKELEFDAIERNWIRLGLDKCSLRENFAEKKFNSICLKLVSNRLNELANANQTESIEENLLKSIEDVNNKYHTSSALNYYNVKDKTHILVGNVFKNMNKKDLEKIFYKRLSVEVAGTLAKNRFSASTTLKEALASIQELQKTHNNRSFIFKLFHPIKNAEENRNIREMKDEVMRKFNVSKIVLENKLRVEIDKSTLKTFNLYKLDEFINENCYEKSGKLYSQKIIDDDNEDLVFRAENDFVQSQNDLNNLVDEQEREPIIVDDAKENKEMERSKEAVRDDSIIIKVPNNNK